MSTKSKLLSWLRSNKGRRGVSAAQARAWWGFEGVKQRVHDLRNDGHYIMTNSVYRSDSNHPVAVYSYGTYLSATALKRR